MPPKGRFTWRHDSVLKSILINLKNNLPHDVKIYADLDHWRAEDNPPSTIPPEILSTSSRPDIVIIHSTREIQILELTVPSNSKSALQNAIVRKQSKENYNYLVNDLKDRKWNTTYHTVEIGSLGHIPSSAKEAIIDILPRNRIQLSSPILLQAAKVSITCSQQIFMAHKQMVWCSTRSLIT